MTKMERLERTTEEWSLLIRTAVAFGLYFFSKMDEVHIISDMHMNEAGIPMLVTMSQYKNGDQGSNNGSRSILVVHNDGLIGRLNTNVNMKN